MDIKDKDSFLYKKALNSYIKMINSNPKTKSSNIIKDYVFLTKEKILN